MKKSLVIEEIQNRLLTDLEMLQKAARASHEEAIHPSSKAENKYDTRGLEASYLANGQVKQAVETEQSILEFQKLDGNHFPDGSPIAVGALIHLKRDGDQLYFFVGPRAGGVEVVVEGTEIVIITPQAPLGQVLMGKVAGDKFKVPHGKSAIAYEVVSVC